MAAGRKTGGRKKGTPNKLTATVKEAIEAAAEDLGGKDRLVKWAKEDSANERVFWSQIYTKLLPLQVDAKHDLSDPVKDLLNAVAKSSKRIGT